MSLFGKERPRSQPLDVRARWNISDEDAIGKADFDGLDKVWRDWPEDCRLLLVGRPDRQRAKR